MKFFKASFAVIVVMAAVNATMNNIAGTIFCCTAMLILHREVRGE